MREREVGSDETMHGDQGWIGVPKYLRGKKGVVGGTWLREEIAAGRVESRRIGRRILVRPDLLDRLPETQQHNDA